MPLNEQRAVANVRERKRTQKLNQAYKQLQSIIPKEPSDKMSKIHTLKLAQAYIDFLNHLLKESDNESSTQNLTEQVHSTSSSLNFQHNNQQSVNSPCATATNSSSSSKSSPSFAHYSTASDQDEELDEALDPFQHKNKRARLQPSSYGPNQLLLDKVGHTEYGHTSPQGTASTCYLKTEQFAPEQSVFTSEQIPTGYNNAIYYTTTNTNINHTTQNISDDQGLTIHLRNAFREYRSNKRKRESLNSC